MRACARRRRAQHKGEQLGPNAVGRNRADARARGHPAVPAPRRVARSLPSPDRDDRRPDSLRRAHLDAGRPAAAAGVRFASLSIPTAMRRWLLPEYIEDILPGEALRIEALR